MRRKMLALGVIAASAVLAQVFQTQTPVMAAEEPAYTPPMTSWGEPDIRGMWPLNHLIGVPMQRDPKYGDRATMTDEEFAAELERRHQEFLRDPSIGIPWEEVKRRSLEG